MAYYELTHDGIKGMKWGVRRYQNKDGTLTEAGKRRYGRDAYEKDYDQQDEQGTYYKTSSKKGKRENLKFDAERYAREDNERLRDSLKTSSDLANKTNQVIDQIPKKKATRMDLSKMSDQELRAKINRELLERQYDDMFNDQNVNRGRERAQTILGVTGTVLGATATAVTLAIEIAKLVKGL